MYFVLFMVFFTLLLILRAAGDESIGFGGTYTVDGTVVPKIVKLGVPDETTGVVESKTLDLPEATIRKLGTLKNGGSFTVVWQLTNAPFQALETLRKARSIVDHVITVPIDTGTLEYSVPGLITSNKVEDLEAENITTVTTMVEVTGPPNA